MTYDVSLVRSAGVDPDRWFLWQTRIFDVREPLEFVANIEALRGRDLPVPEPSTWPVMSRRMLDVLISVGSFARRAIRCVVIDDKVMPADRYDDRGLRRDVTDDRFVVLHLTEHVRDAFPWDRSEYERDDRDPAQVLAVPKLVLRDVPLPPVFRLAPYPRVLFVSAAAKVALEVAKVVGAHFVPSEYAT